jgi:hypothetical protein
MKKYLISFYGEGMKGNDEFWIKRQEALNKTALDTGNIDKVISWNKEKLKTTGYWKRNRKVLDTEDGAGLWAWKSYIIFDLLCKINDGDVIIYYDVGSKDDNGYEINTAIDPLIKWAIENNNGILTGFYRPDTMNKTYTKRDCFVYMGCDEEKYWDHPQNGATYSIWQKNELTMDIVTEWMTYSKDMRIISDNKNKCGLDNLDGKKQKHRHDQSILTNLAIKYGLKCYPKTVGYGKNISSLIKMVEIDNFCLETFGFEFGDSLIEHLTKNNIPNFSEKWEELIKMFKFIKYDNPQHCFHPRDNVFITHTLIDKDNNYISYKNYNIEEFFNNINKMRNKSGERLLDKMWNDLWWTGELKNVKL